MAELPYCISSPSAALDALSALGVGPTLALVCDELEAMQEEGSACCAEEFAHVIDAWSKLPFATRQAGLDWMASWRR